MKLKSFVLFGLLLSGLLFSQVTRKYSNEFLSIGVDARAFAMGNSVVAHQSDVNAVYWNPAGLSEIQNNWQFAAMHAEYFQSIAKYDYLAAVYPTRNSGTIGASIYRFGVDDIINTTELIDSQGNIDYNKLSTFSTADYAAVFSYANHLFGNQRFSMGANAKLIYRHIGKFANSLGFGLDAGIQYRTQDNFYFGVMARDITTTFNVWSVNEDKLKQLEVQGIILNTPPEENIELTLPKMQAGVAKYFEFSEQMGLMGEVDLHFDFTETNAFVASDKLSISPSMGLELNYDKMVYLRGGFNNVQYETNFQGDRNLTLQPNIGLGFRIKGLSIDYALTDIGDQSVALYSNIFSVKIDLDEFY